MIANRVALRLEQLEATACHLEESTFIQEFEKKISNSTFYWDANKFDLLAMKKSLLFQINYPEQPRHPQCTHSTIFPSSSLVFGTRQMQLVEKLVSLV